MNQLFFDTYAFMEISLGTQSYDKYIEHIAPITTLNNLYELHFHLLRIYGEKIADERFEIFREYVIEVTSEDIKQASRFRLQNKQKKFSYIDALGYVMATRRGVRFLTGDKAFKGMSNVEFVV